MGWEVDIAISEAQLRQLGTSPLVGKIRRYSDKGFHSEIDLHLSLGKTSKENEFMDLQTTPEHVYWEQATRYDIVISPLAHYQLYENDSTLERINRNPACKIRVRVVD